MKKNYSKLSGFMVAMALMGAVTLPSCKENEVPRIINPVIKVTPIDKNVYYITGSVTNSADGTAIGGVKVMASNKSGFTMETTTTDSDGSYTLKMSDEVTSGYLKFEPTDKASYALIPTISFTGSTGSSYVAINASLTKYTPAKDVTETTSGTVTTTDEGTATVGDKAATIKLADTTKDVTTESGDKTKTTTSTELTLPASTEIAGLDATTPSLSATEVAVEVASTDTTEHESEDLGNTEVEIESDLVAASAMVLTPSTATFSKPIEIKVTTESYTTPGAVGVVTRARADDKNGFTSGKQVYYDKTAKEWKEDIRLDDAEYNPYAAGDGTYTLKTKSFEYALGATPDCVTKIKAGKDEVYYNISEVAVDNMGTTMSKSTTISYDMKSGWELETLTDGVTEDFKAQIKSYVTNFFGFGESTATTAVSQKIKVPSDSELYVGVKQKVYVYTFTFNDGEVAATVYKYSEAKLNTRVFYGTLRTGHNYWK